MSIMYKPTDLIPRLRLDDRRKVEEIDEQINKLAGKCQTKKDEGRLIALCAERRRIIMGEVKKNAGG